MKLKYLNFGIPRSVPRSQVLLFSLSFLLMGFLPSSVHSNSRILGKEINLVSSSNGSDNFRHKYDGRMHLQKLPPSHSGMRNYKKSFLKDSESGLDLEWLLSSEDQDQDSSEKQYFNKFVTDFVGRPTGSYINGFATTATVVNEVMRTLGAIAAFIVFIIQPIADSIVGGAFLKDNGKSNFDTFGRTDTTRSRLRHGVEQSPISGNFGGFSHSFPNSILSRSLTTFLNNLDSDSSGMDGRNRSSSLFGGKVSAARNLKFEGKFTESARGILDADRCIERISCNVVTFTNGRNFVMDFVRERYSDAHGPRPGQITKRILKTVAKQIGGNCGQYNCNPASFVVRLFIYIMDWNTLFKA